MNESFECNIPINQLESFKGGPIILGPHKTYHLIIDYPFAGYRFDDIKYQVPIKTGTKGIRIFDLFKKINKAFVNAYIKAEVEGWWYGHGIEDLVLEGLTIKNNKINLEIGS